MIIWVFILVIHLWLVSRSRLLLYIYTCVSQIKLLLLLLLLYPAAGPRNPPLWVLEPAAGNFPQLCGRSTAGVGYANPQLCGFAHSTAGISGVLARSCAGDPQYCKCWAELTRGCAGDSQYCGGRPVWCGRAQGMVSLVPRRAWIFLPLGFLDIRRHGHHCDRGIQEDSINDCWETQQALQQDDTLDPMQTELLSAAICHHVRPWIPFSRTPPRWSSHHHQHHGHCLFWGPGPRTKPRLSTNSY